MIVPPVIVDDGIIGREAHFVVQIIGTRSQINDMHRAIGGYWLEQFQQTLVARDCNPKKFTSILSRLRLRPQRAVWAKE